MSAPNMQAPGGEADASAPVPYCSSKFKSQRVFVRELEDIRKARRGGAKDAPQEPEPEPEPEPDTRHHLAGLALSGGGIRSATFNLGVVQAINENGVFEHIDYLSTVSGGGYIGSCISSILAKHSKLPFQHEEGRLEHVAFRHLRNYSNYLAPGGTGEVLRLPAVVLQGMVRNFVAVMPVVLLLAAAELGLWSGAIRARLLNPTIGFPLQQYLPSLIITGVLLAWMLLVAPIWLGRGAAAGDASGAGRRDQQAKFTAWLLVLLLIVVFIDLQPFAVVQVTYFRYGLPVLTGLSAAATAGFAAQLARRAGERVAARYADKLLMAGLAILGPLTLWLLLLLLCSWAISPPDVLGEWGFGSGSGVFAGVHAAASPAQSTAVVQVAADWFVTWAALAYAGLGVIIFLLFLAIYDTNAASLHAFYRDRLARAYLFTYDPPGPFDENAELPANGGLKLSQLSEGRPIHLVNATLNVQSAKTRNMRGRNAGFFVFSRRFCGGEYTGYCETKALEARDPSLDLASAMATSGAAISPNAGTKTNRGMRFLLALLNIRLGYWLVNPQRVADPAAGKRRTRPIPGVSPYYLFKEAFGLLNEVGPYVYLTDGGHIENLGAFELLRRRCRYVIVSDAEADPQLTYNGLAQLIRLARIDLGIDIHIDLVNLRRQPAGTVRGHCAFGAIDYGDGQRGELLYIKASVSGDEAEYINEYRARHPDFPHETTADQFFDEAQFEAYRALGHHIASGLFERRNSESRSEVARPGTAEPEIDVGTWFNNLRNWLRPQPALLEAYLALQREAAELDRRFQEPELSPYSHEIFPELAAALASGREAEWARPDQPDHPLLHLVSEQLRFIERAVLELRLGDPQSREAASYRGLMNLFRRWSQSTRFRRAWVVLIGTHGPDLQRFCREALELRATITWKHIPKSALNSFERRYVGQHDDETIYGCWLGIEPALAGPTDDFVGYMAAFAVVTVEHDATILRFFRIRDTYRRQNLTSRLVRELRTVLVADLPHGPPRYCLATDGASDDLVAAMRLRLEKEGFLPLYDPGL
jgi:hypothetical protein